MTYAEAGLADEPESGGTPLGERSAARHPELQVVALALGLLTAAVLILWALPDRSTAVRSSGPWAFIVVTLMYGLFEHVTFNVQFRREGISFSLSELPLAFSLVFLPPWLAVAARLPLTVLVLLLVRRNTSYKLLFNVGIFVFEATLAVAIFRGMLEVWGESSSAIVVAVVVATGAVAPPTSMLISLAISRFEGGLRHRIVSELGATWWLYTVNAVLGAMTVALAMIAPALSLIAALPAVGIWYVLRSYGELGQELRDLDAVHGFAGRVGQTLDVHEIGEVAVEEVIGLTRGVGVALVVFGPDGPGVHVRGEVGVALPDSTASPGWRTILEDGTVQVVESDRLRRLGIDAEPAIPGVLVAPVVDEGTTFAVLIVIDRNIQARFDADDVARVQNIAQQLGVSLRRGMLHERLEYEARHDALTGLPARTVFEREVGVAVERADPDGRSWVLMLDLDRFKEVNDTLGHHAGDDLLIEFASRMSSLLRPGDVLARLAGDEFAVLCRGRSRDEVVEFARACVLEGGRPVVLDGLEIVVTVSVGVAHITAADNDAVQPIRRADIAMYNAKWQRSGVEVYRNEIDRRTPARLSMLGDLRASIEADELDVAYQPKLELKTGRVVGVEALVRWEHATRGVVPPSEFVRVAEDTGLIKDLTDFVLARGIAMLRTLHDAGLPVGMAVNVSTHDLFDSRLPARVRSYLDSNGVAPAWLTLEITESSLFVDAPRTRATIDELHAVGLRMTVDDFGTGYSSLSYLRRLPVHELKIDQTFVAGMLVDPQDEVIVRSTVDLGHNLGLQVVAEGVESVAVLERLREMGCDVAQGYLISRPVSSDEIVGWLQRAQAAERAERPQGALAWLATRGT